jgi:hypothetical protein
MGAPEKAAVNKAKADTFAVDVNTALVDQEALRIGRQNQLIEDNVYPGLEQALEQQEQLDLESMESVEEQKAQEEAEMRKQMAMGAASGNQLPGQNNGPQKAKPKGGSPFGAKDARPSSAARMARKPPNRWWGSSLDTWNEEDHPRGQPGNAGQFGPGGGGSGAQTKTGKGAKAPAKEAKPEGKAAAAAGGKKTDITQNMGANYEPPEKQVQPYEDVDSLYEAAKKAEPEFMSTVEDFAQKLGGKVIYPPPSSVEPGTRTMKARHSAERKMRDELDGQANQVKDVLRATVVFEDCLQTREAVAEFITVHDAVRVKDRFVEPLGGYRDLMLNFRTSDGTLTELQFNSPKLLEAKFGEGHKLYEKTRALRAQAPSRENDAMILGLSAESERLYSEAYEQDGDGCGWQKDC